MSPATVRIEWLVPKWSGVTEVVSVNRVKTREPLVVGMKVRVSYKSGIFNAQIIDIEQGLKRSMPFDSDSDEDIPLNILSKRIGATNPTEHPPTHAAPEVTQLTPEPTQLAPESSQLPPEPVELAPPHAGTEIELPPAEQPIELPPYQEGPEPVQLPPTHAAPEATGIHPAQEDLDDSRETPHSQVPPATLQLILAELKKLSGDVSRIKNHLGIADNKPEPKYLVLDHQEVMIGAPEVAVHVMSRETYDEIHEKVSTVNEFVLKLTSKLFSDNELAICNYHGGPVLCKGGSVVTKEALKVNDKFKAIMSQAGIEFPGAFASASGRKSLRDSINGKCRKVAAKLSL